MQLRKDGQEVQPTRLDAYASIRQTYTKNNSPRFVVVKFLEQLSSSSWMLTKIITEKEYYIAYRYIFKGLCLCVCTLRPRKKKKEYAGWF